MRRIRAVGPVVTAVRAVMCKRKEEISRTPGTQGTSSIRLNSVGKDLFLQERMLALFLQVQNLPFLLRLLSIASWTQKTHR